MGWLENPGLNQTALAERDALAFLGVLAHMHLRFDPPIPAPNGSAPTHFTGLNIHGLVIDNSDGEVLALARNSIHGSESPLDHGEQHALRSAIDRVRVKRPRGPNTTIEAYYRSQMFTEPGRNLEDFLRKGATLYTSLEPCPMCASTALVARVKRVIFIFNDAKYGGAWTDLKEQFYPNDDSFYGRLDLSGTESPLATRARTLHEEILTRAETLRTEGVRDTHLFDHMRDALGAAFNLLIETNSDQLWSIESDRASNARTLLDLQRALNISIALRW